MSIQKPFVQFQYSIPLANLPEEWRPLGVRASKNKGACQIKRGLCTDMLDPSTAIRAEPVESQRIAVRVNLADQPRTKGCPLCRINFTLKHRILHPLTKVETGARHPSQSPPSGGIFGSNIISYQYQYVFTSR